MLTPANFTKENIERLYKISGNDPSLLEKTVFAFGLLEAITKVGMPFIFKGGTCLMLLLDKPRRLSTDIDIIVEPGTRVGYFIELAGLIFPFKYEEETISMCAEFCLINQSRRCGCEERYFFSGKDGREGLV